MSAPPYMKLFIADYLADTTHLNRDEHGAYLLLLMALWRAGGRLPKNPDKLAKIAKCTPDEWLVVGPVVMDFFKVSGGAITQKRATAEIAKYQGVVKGSKKGGKASAAKRINKISDLPSTDVEKRFNENPTNQNQNQNQKEDADASSPAKANRRKPELTIPDGFPDAPALTIATMAAEAAGVEIQPQTQAERFRNHAEQNDRRCRDWMAAWRNWISKACETAPKVSSPPGLTQPNADGPWRGRMLDWTKNRYWNALDWGPKPGLPGCLVPAHLLPAPTDLLPFPARVVA